MARTPANTDVVLFRCGGHVALDFVNTVDSWVRPPAVDYIDTYEKLVTWSEVAKLIDPQSGRALRNATKKQAASAMAEARDLRKTLLGLFGAIVDGHAPNPIDLKALNAWLRAARGKQTLSYRTDRLQWAWAADIGPRAPVEFVALAAADLLQNGDTGRLKRCPAPDGCGWLFLDESRNRSRRWCSMDYCGSFAKSRRYAEVHNRR